MIAGRWCVLLYGAGIAITYLYNIKFIASVQSFVVLFLKYIS